MVRRIVAIVLALAAVALVFGRTLAPPFEDEIRRFEASDAQHPPKPGMVLFIGSSSIRLWSSLAKDFPRFDTLNRGFGGSEISDSVRLVDRIVTPYKPRAIVFFAGTNDIWAGKSPETVATDFKAFVDKVRMAQPGVPIAFISLSPAPSRWSKIAEVRKTNELVRAYCESTPGLTFVDAYPRMVNAIGGPRPELYIGDNLHLKPTGYAIWRELVEPVLERITTPDR